MHHETFNLRFAKNKKERMDHCFKVTGHLQGHGNAVPVLSI
jgi:hypothetical protein